MLRAGNATFEEQSGGDFSKCSRWAKYPRNGRMPYRAYTYDGDSGLVTDRPTRHTIYNKNIAE